MYRNTILDHYKHPRNFGTLKNPTNQAHAYNATCGDRIDMQLNVTNGKVTDVMFQGEGCAISQASASMLTERVKGMETNDVMKLKAHDIIDILGTTLTPSRTKCATLPLEVLQKALYGSK